VNYAGTIRARQGKDVGIRHGEAFGRYWTNSNAPRSARPSDENSTNIYNLEAKEKQIAK
jgi:hypothetical protein